MVLFNMKVQEMGRGKVLPAGRTPVNVSLEIVDFVVVVRRKRDGGVGWEGAADYSVLGLGTGGGGGV